MPEIPEGREPLLRYLTVQSQLDRELSLILKEAARDTERRIRALGRGNVRAQQLQILLVDIRRMQHELWERGVGPAIAQHIPDAETAAERAAGALDTYLSSVVSSNVAQTFINAFQTQLQRGLDLDRLRVSQQLSLRVYRNAELSSGRIERIIRSAIIRGLSARELAEQIVPLIKPSVRGGVSYAAMRLGRTELNNAFHQRQIEEAQREWVQGVKWNLSKSHPRVDGCDILAQRPSDYGLGVYEKDSVPDKPHPQCLCYLTYDVMNEQEAQELILARINNGQFDSAG